MTTRLTIFLLQDERDALGAMAEHERRELREQAALVIRQTLERRGFLPRAPAPKRQRVHFPPPPRGIQLGAQ